MKIWNSDGQQNSISDALGIILPEHAVISIVGAGGKTSLMFAWARELADSGKKVVVTTTTHMLHPKFAGDIYEGSAVIYYPKYAADSQTLSEDFAQIDELLSKDKILMLTTTDPANERKVTAAPDEIFDYACNAADVVLIEADGSRSMPVKMPKSHEPVVPSNTDVTVCVAGLSSLGRPIKDVLYGADQMLAIDMLGPHPADEAFITATLAHPSGGSKGAVGEFRVYLNQADTTELQEKAVQISELLNRQNILCAWGTLK